MWWMMPGYLMAFDRPDDDFEAGEARLEQHLRNSGSRGDVPADRSEPAETRTREEYYEVLRVADGASGDGEPADGEPADGGSGSDKPADGGSGSDKPADGGSGEDSSADDKPAHDKPGDDGSADDPHVADPRTDHSASLAAHKTPVTPEERDELLALLEAMNMPTDPIELLNVQG